MGSEITIALKRLSDIQTARLIVDECPPDPRADGSAMTTIVAWRRDHRMSDTEIYGTKQEFRENVLDRMEKNRTARRPRPVRVYEHESRGMVRDLMDAGRSRPALATKRWSSKVIWIRSGWLRGSIYWVLLFRGRFSVAKPLSRIQRSTFLPLQDANLTPSLGGFGLSLDPDGVLLLTWPLHPVLETWSHA